MSARFAMIVVILASLARTAPLHGQEAQPNNPNQLRQVVYPVADLIVPVDMDTTKPQRGASPTLEHHLIQLVCITCAPNTWADVGGPGSIRYMPKEMKLIVCQTVQCHEQIRELFAQLRKLQDVEISIDTRYLTLSPARAKQLEALGDRGKFSKFLPSDGPDAVCLSDRELLLLFALAQEDRSCSVMAAPKIIMFNGQKCSISVLDDVRVKDGDIDQDGKALTSPKVEVGIRNVLQPVIEPQDGSVRLAVECSQTAQSDTTPRGRVFATQRIKHVVRVPQSQTVALKLGADAKDRHQYVLLTPRVIRQSEEEVAKRTADEPKPPMKRPRSERHLRVFPVADLLVPIVADPVADPQKNRPAKRIVGFRRAEPMTAPAFVELITASVAPSTWQRQGGEGTIDYYPLGQALIVLNHDNVQEEVDKLLAGLRRLHDLRVSLDCRVVEMTEAAFERISQGKSRMAAATPSAPREAGSEEQNRTAPVRSIPTSAATTSVSKSLLPLAKTGLTLNQREAHELRRLLAEETPALTEHVLGAVTFNGCRVRMDKTRPYTYTTDVNVGIEDGRIVVKPVTRTIRVGTVIEALPILNADREGLALEINVQHSILQSTIIPTQTVRVGPKGEETEYVLETPSLGVIDTKTVVDLAKTGTLVLPLGAVLSECRTEFGPPVLGKIPYVNRLFRNIGYGREARHFYVVITPQLHAR